MIWTDPAGLRWEVIDWHRPNLAGKRKRLELGAWNSEGRAFVPVAREGPVMIFEFGRIAYRDTGERTLRDQLKNAKPSTVRAVERLAGGRSHTAEDGTGSNARTRSDCTDE